MVKLLSSPDRKGQMVIIQRENSAEKENSVLPPLSQNMSAA